MVLIADVVTDAVYEVVATPNVSNDSAEPDPGRYTATSRTRFATLPENVATTESPVWAVVMTRYHADAVCLALMFVTSIDVNDPPKESATLETVSVEGVLNRVKTRTRSPTCVLNVDEVTDVAKPVKLPD